MVKRSKPKSVGRQEADSRAAAVAAEQERRAAELGALVYHSEVQSILSSRIRAAKQQ